MHPCWTPFPIWNHSTVPCMILTVVSWFACRFIRRQVRWSGTPFSSRFFHILLWSIVKRFSAVNRAEVDVFLEFCCFLLTPMTCFLLSPMNVVNLTSALSFSLKPSLYIWKFSSYVLLKPSLKDFEDNLVSMWNECNCTVTWMLYGIAFLWDWNETGLFQSCGHFWVSQICWNIKCSTLTSSSFRIWNRSTGIPSPPLALFIVMLPKAHLTSHSRMSGSRWVIPPFDYLAREDAFCVFCVFLPSLLNIFCFC